MVKMENRIIAIKAELKDDIVDLVWWESDRVQPFSWQGERCNIEGTRPLLDKIGELIGLELSVKSIKD